MDVLCNSLNFTLFSANIWFVILIDSFTIFYMTVLFGDSLVGSFNLVFMVLLSLFIYSLLKFCIRISKKKLEGR